MEGGNNSDIDDFLGYFHLSGQYSINEIENDATRNRINEVMTFGVNLQKGAASNKGSVRVDSSFSWEFMREKIEKIGFLKNLLDRWLKERKFNPHWLIQVWYGDGENLLDYNRRETNVRIGVLFKS